MPEASGGEMGRVVVGDAGEGLECVAALDDDEVPGLDVARRAGPAGDVEDGVDGRLRNGIGAELAHLAEPQQRGNLAGFGLRHGSA